jgi:hypothetical protein
MTDEGFEALADGTLLVTVLLVASAVAGSLAHPATDDGRLTALRYAEDTRLALFRTTPGGLRYSVGGAFVAVRNDTTIESFLRLEVHLLRGGARDFDFGTANRRITEQADRLVRPGWRFSITGGVGDGSDLFRLPIDAEVPSSYGASGWTYPPLDGTGGDTRLSLALWVSPHR